MVNLLSCQLKFKYQLNLVYISSIFFLILGSVGESHTSLYIFSKLKVNYNILHSCSSFHPLRESILSKQDISIADSHNFAKVEQFWRTTLRMYRELSSHNSSYINVQVLQVFFESLLLFTNDQQVVGVMARHLQFFPCLYVDGEELYVLSRVGLVGPSDVFPVAFHPLGKILHILVNAVHFQQLLLGLLDPFVTLLEIRLTDCVAFGFLFPLEKTLSKIGQSLLEIFH